MLHLFEIFRRIFQLFIATAVMIELTDAAELNTSEVSRRLDELAQQNANLLKLIEQQQSEIDSLKSRLSEVADVSQDQAEQIDTLQDSGFSGDLPSHPPSGGSSIHISGEAGIAFHSGGANTNFPNNEFRVDEARVFIEAQVANTVYLFSELELFSRETNNPDIQLGELYVEVENLITVDNLDRAVNLRAGRLDIPFGEEYQTRDVMSNPLISHSISDFWGIDEGFELFGEIGNASYVVALQNGSRDTLRDYTPDKSITARFGIDPLSQLHLSGSVMRTGNIDVDKEALTELWFGDGFFRSIGSDYTTEFNVELAQLDASFHWNDGYLKAAYGEAWYEDNDAIQNNSKDFNFWSIEIQQALKENFFAAVRYSGMNVNGGYPVAGMASRGRYFFGPNLTEELRRLSVGFSFWPFADFVLKADFTWEDGEDVRGVKRSKTDQFSAEAGVRF